MDSTKRLQIALVSDSVLPFHKGGKESRIYHFAKALTEMGQDVHIYTMQWWPGDKTYKKDSITYHAICRLYPLYNGERRSYIEGILFGLACLKMAFYKFDVVETDHMPYFPLFSVKVACLIRRKPLFATWHEVVGWRAWKDYLGFINGTVAYLIEQLSVLMPNHIVAVSDHTKQQLRDVLHYKGQVSLVTNGIDYTRIKPIKPANLQTDVVFVGRLIAHKNVDLLIKAIAELRAKRPDIRCVIVGGGPEEQRLRALVKKLALDKNVTLTGRLESSDDVYAYMKSSKVFATPSAREGFGITILEAYACGLTVVTVKHRDNAGQYLVQDGAGIVCELTAHAIAQAIDELLNKPSAANALNAADFDWHERASALKGVYSL